METHRIRELLVVSYNHPSTGGEPDHMWTLVDENEVVLSVVKFLGEASSDSDASSTTAKDYDVLLLRRGCRHGGGRGWRAGVNIERR